jgi:hypothetical protein
MKNIIHHIRKQPEHIKRHVLHIITLVFGAVLVLLWIYSLGTNLASPNTQVKISQDLQPLSALKANIIGGYNSITGSDGSGTQ